MTEPTRSPAFNTFSGVTVYDFKIHDTMEVRDYEDKAMSRNVNVTLTEYELETLLACADNGIGDGDFYVNPDGSSTGSGDGTRSIRAYDRAVEKCRAALRGKAA